MTAKTARAPAKAGDLSEALAALDGARASVQMPRLRTPREVIMRESLSE